ncbi:MAG: hypothetical protein ACNS62_23810 [Candidatus Cyclobacteriaceae bacterium M3_2C_046]
MNKDYLLLLAIFWFYSGQVLAQPTDQDSLNSSSRDSLQWINSAEEDTIIKEIQDYSQRKHFLARLLNGIMVEKRNGDQDWNYSYRSYQAYEGMVIGNIHIDVLDVFGEEIDNPQSKTKSWFEKAGDWLHIKTRHWIIRNQLLFNVGEALEPFKISESERILRNKNYIFDAAIKCEKISADSIDVTVTVQDIWSITPDGAAYISSNSFRGSLEDINFLGLGARLEAGILVGNRFDGFNWSGRFLADNIKDFVNVELSRTIRHDLQIHGINVYRDFFSPVINWAGGAELTWNDLDHYLWWQDTIKTVPVSFNQQSFWLGYATDFSEISSRIKQQNEYHFSIGYSHTNYVDYPREYRNHLIQDKKEYLVSLGYNFRRYHKVQYVSQLGRTEDIPSGTLATLTAGYEQGALSDRPYLGLTLGYSFYKPRFGYLSALLKGGTYKNGDRLEESIISWNLLYFTNLIKLGNYKMRHFIWTRHAYVHRPIQLNQLLQLNNQEGIRGARIRHYYGNKKAVLNYELNIYPPVKFLGFNFAFIGFADFGILGQTDEKLWNNQLYQGYGLGLRVRNEHLIFRSIQILFGYYPYGIDTTHPRFKVFEQSRLYYDLNQIRFTQPSTVQF